MFWFHTYWDFSLALNRFMPKTESHSSVIQAAHTHTHLHRHFFHSVQETRFFSSACVSSDTMVLWNRSRLWLDERFTLTVALVPDWLVAYFIRILRALFIVGKSHAQYQYKIKSSYAMLLKWGACMRVIDAQILKSVTEISRLSCVLETYAPFTADLSHG